MEAITQWDHGGLFALTLTDKKGTTKKKDPRLFAIIKCICMFKFAPNFLT